MTSEHKLFEEAQERHEHLKHGHDKLTPLAAAIIAVLASLATLFAHHRSIQALAIKNEAILYQAKASDQYAYYQAKRIKYTLYTGLLAAGVARDDAARKSLQSTSAHESTSSLVVLASARKYERQSVARDARAEGLMRSFETLSIATTLLEIAIVLVSISALAETRMMLLFGCGLSVAGIILMAIGELQH